MTKLSILIPTLPKRKEMFNKLWDELLRQREPYGNDVELIAWEAEPLTIGEKRNKLLDLSESEYVAFIDDDDKVSENYIALLMEGINKGVDCCSLKGRYFVDGRFDGVFEHSIKHKSWFQTDFGEIKYFRCPNHLNCIKSEIAKQFKFPEKNWGEDKDWSEQIHKSGLLKTEHYIPEQIYFYLKITK